MASEWLGSGTTGQNDWQGRADRAAFRTPGRPASGLPFSDTATDPTTIKSTRTLESKPTGTLKFRTPYKGKRGLSRGLCTVRVDMTPMLP